MNNYNHSRPFDVHIWSEHPEINVLVNEVWSRFWEEEAEAKPKRGPKPKAPKKKHLKVLLLDLYVCWQSNPSMYLSVHMSKSGWKADSRYNALNLSSQMIGIIKRLTDLGFLEFKAGFEGRLSRIRPTEKLTLLFKLTKLKNEDVSYHNDKEMLILKAGDNLEGINRGEKIEYLDTPETLAMRDVLKRYNALLRRSHIDVCSLEKPYVERVSTTGKKAGELVKIHIDNRNVFVKRIFNNNSWEHGGRFYGGWWQFIERDLRNDIMINGKPTVEIDYKAMHIALLFSEIGYHHEYDPYTLDASVFPKWNDFDQRQSIKQLVLMAVNASSKAEAFRAFRADQPEGDPFKRLTDKQLEKLLNAFIKKYPELEPYLCSGKGLELMYRDSCIAEHVIDHFTRRDVPILCIHDSFIVPFDQVLELRAIMTEAGAKIAKRYLFTDKKGFGLDEWFTEYENTGARPSWGPKETEMCEGYLERRRLLTGDLTGMGLMCRELK